MTTHARRALVEERKAQIIQAAIKVFAAKGFERATISDIARAAGVAEGSIYNYFKNKADLLVSIPRQKIEPAVQSITAHLPETATTPEAALTMIAQNLVTTIRDNAFLIRILLSALPSMNQSAREKYMQTVLMYALALIETYMRELIKQGVLRADLNPVVAARAFVGLFFPFIVLREILQVDTESDWNYDELIPTLVPMFLNGALAESPKRKSR
jgi:AcrR family transcriptional regulator